MVDNYNRSLTLMYYDFSCPNLNCWILGMGERIPLPDPNLTC